MRQNRSTSFPKKSVHIENAALKICLFVKPVDTNEYLEWPSCHHCHDKKRFRPRPSSVKDIFF